MPAEVIKLFSSCLLPHLSELVELIWKEEFVPQDFKDAVIVHLYKCKDSCCDNRRGISLLSIAGKILARILLNRLGNHVYQNDILPESQCGFRPAWGTMDMIFAVRQIQEKSGENHRDLVWSLISLKLSTPSADLGCGKFLRKLAAQRSSSKSYNHFMMVCTARW